MSTNTTMARLLAVTSFATLSLLGGCAPMGAGQMAEGGFNAARSAIGALSPTTAGTDERQKRIQTTLNEVDVGDDIDPVLQKIDEPPREKSGNAQGYTCYEFPSVYSAADSAVLMAHNGKVVFYGSSRCAEEMKVENFRGGGKYSVGGASLNSS